MKLFWKILPWLIGVFGLVGIAWALYSMGVFEKSDEKKVRDARDDGWGKDDFPIQKGDAGKNVLELQRRLNWFIRNVGDGEEIPENAKMDEKTVKTFEKWHPSKMPVTKEDFSWEAVTELAEDN